MPPSGRGGRRADPRVRHWRPPRDDQPGLRTARV